jgi:lipoprotein NlpI
MQPDLLSELRQLMNQMQSRQATNFSLDHPDNALFNRYGIYATQNPEYRAAIDSFYQQSGISPHLALLYPDAAHEIALLP